MNWNKIGVEVGLGTLYTSVATGVSCAFAKFMGTPMLLSGIITAITMIATCVLNTLCNWLAQRFNWNQSTANFIALSIGALITVASIVASVAFNCITPWGMVLFSFAGLFGLAMQIAQAAALKQSEV